MKVKFKEEYLSIRQFDDTELPDFAVLTGVNGSGKTHLLQAAKLGNVDIDNIDPANIVYFNYENFRLENENIFSAYQVKNEKKEAWEFFVQNKNADIRNNIERWKNSLGTGYVSIKKKCIDNSKSLWELKEEDIQDNGLFQQLVAYKGQIDNHFHNHHQLQNNNHAQGILTLIKKLQFSIDEITKEDFIALYEPYSYKNDFLPQQLGKVFMNYFSKYEQNQYNEFRRSNYGEDKKVLSDDEFLSLYGEKPWDLINEILSQLSSMDYRVNTPEGTERDENFQLQLTSLKDPSIKPQFTELSSGEKTLMALVASIYKSSSDNHFPSLLLLDEIDTSLHPAMIQNLLDVISNIFLQKGVKVILVTHSPTTVALSPDESIFVMSKSGKNRIRSTPKSKALSILTEGYATLDEGIKLFDQISAKKVSIITEGHNAKYIERAIQLLSEDLTNKVEVILGIESRSGKDQLKTLFDFFTRAQHTSYAIFVWDCDMTAQLAEKNRTIPFIFENNSDNTKVLKGIENLFDEKHFKDEFYIKKPKPDGGFHSSLDKEKFKKYILNNGNENDFNKFVSLIKLIEKLLQSN